MRMHHIILFVNDRLLKNIIYCIKFIFYVILSYFIANMWAQAWGPLGDVLLPYPNLPSIDITQSLIV